jgi:hypothetical protein
MQNANMIGYCPAGYYSRYQGLVAYTRYKSRVDRTKHTLSVLEQGKHHVIIDSPDRVLMLADNMFHANSSLQTQNWHEMTCLSHYHQAGQDLPLRYVMTNYTESLGVRENHDTDSCRYPLPDRGTQIIADSGGFQLSMGDYDFIDPLDEIHWVNKNADLSMVLDVPCSRVSDMALTDRCATLQKNNTLLWLEHKRKDLELINIFHGSDLKAVAHYRKIVEHPDIDRVAISGIGFFDVITGIDRAISLLLDLQDYKHHHFLGITDRKLLVMLMYISKLGFSKHITFDSTSASRLAAYKNFLHLPISEKGIKIEEDFGCKNNYVSSHSKLACCCPVCSVVVYEDVLRSVRGNVIDSLLGLHTHYIYNDWVQTTQDVIQDNDSATIKKFLDYQFGRSKARDLHVLMDYLDEIKESGLRKAKEKFGYHFKRTKSLFTTTKANFGLDEAESEAPIDYEHVRKVVANYEKYHNER